MFCSGAAYRSITMVHWKMAQSELDEIDQKVCLNMVKKDQLCAIALMTKK